jgi:hypothetical protein
MNCRLLQRFSLILMVGMMVGAVNAQPLTPNQKFVNQLYLDLLDRTPSTPELNALATPLDSASITRTQAAAVITSGDEFVGDQVTDFFQLLLHRTPSAGDAAPFVSAIKSGQTFEDTQAFIAGSPEYFANRSGSTNDGFLDAFFSDELNRAVDPISRSTFDGLLGGSTTRTQVAQLILTSTEYRQDLVTEYYNEFLRRAPDPSGLSGGVSFLGSSTDQNYIDTLLGSQEYFNLAQAIPEPVCSSAIVLMLLVRRRRAGSEG